MMNGHAGKIKAFDAKEGAWPALLHDQWPVML